MTATTKTMHPTQQSDSPLTFRIGPDGELELMTEAEVDVLVARVLNEAVKQVRPIRTWC
jgi:hypothetical protein